MLFQYKLIHFMAMDSWFWHFPYYFDHFINPYPFTDRPKREKTKNLTIIMFIKKEQHLSYRLKLDTNLTYIITIISVCAKISVFE